MKYKIGDIVILKRDASAFSWHRDNPKKKFLAKICGKSKFDLYLLLVFSTYSKKEDWGYTEEQIKRKATQKEKMQIFFEELWTNQKLEKDLKLGII